MYATLCSCIILPTRYKGCLDHLMWQKFLQELSGSPERTISRTRKLCCHLSKISWWYKFVDLACCIWVSFNSKQYQHLGEVDIAWVNDKWRSQKIYHDFIVDGQVYYKLFYLVDGIYSHLTNFLGTATDPILKLDSSFAINQEASRKDVEWGFGVLKLKFQILSNPINLHHQDNTYCVVMASILMHNMMVDAQVGKDEVDNGGMYDLWYRKWTWWWW